jgi:hypothetical protein
MGAADVDADGERLTRVGHGTRPSATMTVSSSRSFNDCIPAATPLR